jgi:LPS sulfotransferase NodH
LLGEALYFAGGLGCPLEYFHRGFRPGFVERWGTSNLLDYVQAVHRLRTDPTGTLSVKLFWSDIEELVAELDPATFSDLAGRSPEDLDAPTHRRIAALLEPLFPNPQFIHLKRMDRLRQAVSGLTAVQTGLFRIVPEMGAPSASAAPEYDFDRIDSLVAYSDRCHGHWRNHFEAIGATPYRLTYEMLVSDYQGSVRRLLDVVGSSAPVSPIRLKRQSSSDSEAFVLRYLRERNAHAR